MRRTVIYCWPMASHPRRSEHARYKTSVANDSRHRRRTDWRRPRVKRHESAGSTLAAACCRNASGRPRAGRRKRRTNRDACGGHGGRVAACANLVCHHVRQYREAAISKHGASCPKRSHWHLLSQPYAAIIKRACVCVAHVISSCTRRQPPSIAPINAAATPISCPHPRISRQLRMLGKYVRRKEASITVAKSEGIRNATLFIFRKNKTPAG